MSRPRKKTYKCFFWGRKSEAVEHPPDNVRDFKDKHKALEWINKKVVDGVLEEAYGKIFVEDEEGHINSKPLIRLQNHKGLAKEVGFK